MMCPPEDFRFSYMVDAYTEKLREMTSRHPDFPKRQKHQFIDTDPIVGVIWDMTPYWLVSY
jgi:hypothetical protein